MVGREDHGGRVGELALREAGNEVSHASVDRFDLLVVALEQWAGRVELGEHLFEPFVALLEVGGCGFGSCHWDGGAEERDRGIDRT